MAMVASPSAAAAAAISPSSSGPSPRFHVLAVDDSVLDRKLIERLLRTSSYHVTAVDSVTKALEFLGMHQQGGPASAPSSSCSSSSSYYFHQQEISLIITDYSMPGMTGYDLLKTVKGSGSPLRDIPIVIMSSENVPARINRCLEEGADEFFLKPVKLADMSKLKPHILRGKSTATKNDRDEGTRGNSLGQVLQEGTQQQQRQQHQLQQQMLLPEQVRGDTVADMEAAAADSPRSNKRKAAQGVGDSLLNQRTRMSSTRDTASASSTRISVGRS